MTWPLSFPIWWLRQSAIMSQGEAVISRRGAPGWHLGPGGGSRMGRSVPDAGGEGRRVSGQGVETFPPCYLPGLAWACWDLPCNEVTLFIRSDCQEIGSWISIFTRGWSVWEQGWSGPRGWCVAPPAPRLEGLRPPAATPCRWHAWLCSTGDPEGLGVPNLGRNIPCRGLSTPSLGTLEGWGCKPGGLLWSWLWGSQIG